MASVAHMSSDGTKMKIGKAFASPFKIHFTDFYKQKRAIEKLDQKTLYIVLSSVANIPKDLERNGNAKALTM